MQDDDTDLLDGSSRSLKRVPRSDDSVTPPNEASNATSKSDKSANDDIEPLKCNSRSLKKLMLEVLKKKS